MGEESFPPVPEQGFFPGLHSEAVAINIMEKNDEDGAFEQGL